MKKNVAGQVVGAQLNSTTGTTTVYVSGDGGAQAAGSVGSGACTHRGNGYWDYAPAQAETNYAQIEFTFVNTAAAAPATVQVYTSYPQTGDAYAQVGVAGAGLTALGDTRVAHLDVDVSTRSTFAGGAVASVTGSVGSVASYGTLVADVATAVWGAGTRTLSSFGTLVADVWAYATRRLTDGTNIVLTKGVGLLGLNDIAAGTAMTLTSGERIATANEVEAQIIDDTDSEKVLTAITDKIASVNPSLSGLTLAAIASQVRTELTAELARVDVAISSRLADADYTAPDNANIASNNAGIAAIYDHIGVPQDWGSGSTIVGNLNDANSWINVIMYAVIDAGFGNAALKTLIDALPSATATATHNIDNSSPAAGSWGESSRNADAKAADIQIKLGTPASSVSADIAAIATAIAALNDLSPAELATALDDVLAQIALVKERTDNLPDDPAAASDTIAADIVKVRGQSLTGSGSDATPWGPA